MTNPDYGRLDPDGSPHNADTYMVEEEGAMGDITSRSFFVRVQMREGNYDWGSAWDEAERKMNEFVDGMDGEIINVETFDHPITGSSIAQQRRSGGGVGYRVIYRETNNA